MHGLALYSDGERICMPATFCLFIVSLSGEVWVHKTSLIPPVSSQETERTCIHVSVKGVDFDI